MSTKEGELHFAPEFVPVPYISPSRLHSLKECPLREAWASAKAPELLPRSPNASLGTAIHRLLESAGKGELSPNQLAIRWTSLLGDVERDMAADWRARHLVPLERSVRDFEVRRLQAFAGARELMRMSKAALPATGPGRRGQGFEIEVESRDGTVRGRIDEVRSTPDGVVLRDYKSGSIYEKDAPQSREIKESYVMQLMLYAAVYSECYGRWPDFVELVPVNGNAVRLLVDRNACVALLEDGVATLEEVNVTIRDLAPNGQALETRLARPSPGACAFCPYRPGCSSYRAARSADSTSDWPRDVWGKLEEIRSLPNGSRMLKVDTGQRIRGLSPDDRRHPALGRARVGDRVGLFGLRRTSSERTFLETNRTVIYREDFQ